MDREIIDKLEADFDESRVKIKKVKGRPDADYLEAYDVINKANEIFGYGRWGTEITNQGIHEAGGRTVCVVTLELSVDGCLPRQDVGVNISAGGSPEALETAIKGAASDALKRAMRHFGKQFGNDLYDKDRNGVTVKGEKEAEKPKNKKGGKVSGDPMSVLWDWANAQKPGVKEGAVKEALANNGGDPEKALIVLKELAGA